jgi:hypothetical protein
VHIKLTNGVPENYSIGQLRRDNPQVSFPKSIPDDTLALYDVYPLKAADPPAHATNEVAEDAGYLQLADGTWKQAWRVRPANEKEIEQQARSVRADRNQRLAVCDWTQLPDAPVDQAAWAAYRQALRDVTAQSGFPWSVVWPDAPAN